MRKIIYKNEFHMVLGVCRWLINRYGGSLYLLGLQQRAPIPARRRAKQVISILKKLDLIEPIQPQMFDGKIRKNEVYKLKDNDQAINALGELMETTPPTPPPPKLKATRRRREQPAVATV